MKKKVIAKCKLGYELEVKYKELINRNKEHCTMPCLLQEDVCEYLYFEEVEE